MLTRGTAFFYQDLGSTKKHLRFVLSDPNHPSGKVLCVNFATPGGLCPDAECFVDPSQYAWLRYRSVVAFSRRIVGNAAILERLIVDGTLEQPNPPTVPLATVDFVAAKAKNSKELSKTEKSLLN